MFVSLISIGMAILTPCLASLITKNSGKQYGTTLGIFSSINSLGQMLGVVIGSILMIWFVHLPLIHSCRHVYTKVPTKNYSL
jgi:DHA1 family multidrug resistance protein-like MFS transporter